MKLISAKDEERRIERRLGFFLLVCFCRFVTLETRGSAHRDVSDRRNCSAFSQTIFVGSTPRALETLTTRETNRQCEHPRFPRAPLEVSRWRPASNADRGVFRPLLLQFETRPLSYLMVRSGPVLRLPCNAVKLLLLQVTVETWRSHLYTVASMRRRRLPR